jgi:hypothetical protein
MKAQRMKIPYCFCGNRRPCADHPPQRLVGELSHEPMRGDRRRFPPANPEPLNPDRWCLFCEHFGFAVEYSEITCRKGHYHEEPGWWQSEHWLRELMRRGETCGDFELSDYARKRG